MPFTRDSVVLIVGAIASVTTGLTASFGLFPWIPMSWQHGISITGFILSSVCTYLRMSPLPLSAEGRIKVMGDMAPNSGRPPVD